VDVQLFDDDGNDDPYVDVFVAAGGIPTLALVSGMWESLTTLTLHVLFW
jgi:hypothetical protein